MGACAQINPPEKAEQRTETSEESTIASLPSHEIKILRLLAEKDGTPISAKALADRLDLNITKTKHFLAVLRTREYIDASITIGSPAKYYLTQKGRAFLVNNGLV